MKIAFLNIYGGRVSRGAEVAIDEIAKRLNSKHQITVFQSGNLENASYSIQKISSIPIISPDISHNIILRVLKKFYLDPYSLLVLFFTLQCIPKILKNRYDLLVPINGFWQIIICKLIRLLFRKKIILFGYAGIGIDDYVNLKLNPDAFFTMSQTALSWAKKVSPKIPIKVLPGGVDTLKFKPDIKPMELPFKPPIILTVAALSVYKRIDLVIKAVSKLPHASLVVAGNGILKEEIELLGKKMLPGRFLRLDIGFQQLPSLYSACQVFTLPSNHSEPSIFSKLTGVNPSEAFGIVYLEAMSCGLPIVAPNDPLRKEIIGNAGILVNCEDINEYSLALNQALQRTWGSLPREQANKFSWDKIVSQFSNDLVDIFS